MAKRGRKASKDSITLYFGDIQENAVKEYLSSTDKEKKNEIYMNTLKPAFEKMVESIIRRYNLYVPDEESGETFNDTLSFLFSKAEKYSSEKGTKAYSYFGTICKNYLIGRNKKIKIDQVKYDNYETIGTLGEQLGNDIRYSSIPDKNSMIAKQTVAKLIERITDMVEHSDDYCLKESEVELGKALVVLFDNWDYVLTTQGSDKLNKSAILLFLKERTGLSAKGIRDNMKKFKKEFLLIKNYLIT